MSHCGLMFDVTLKNCIFTVGLGKVCVISEIFDGQAFTFQEFKAKYQVKGTVLDYERLLYCIRNNLLNVEAYMGKEYNPRVEKAIKKLLACDKGTRPLYDVLSANNSTIPSQERWQAELEQYNIQISPEMWIAWYKLPWKCTNSTKLQSLQYKINHRFLVTNRILFHMNFRDDDVCSLCGADRETILHMFVECPQTKIFWNKLKEWMTEHMRCNIQLSETDILFGKLGCNNSLVNHLLVTAKQYIYNTRLFGVALNLDSIVNIYKGTFKTEKLSAKVNSKNDMFVRKWAPLYFLFQHI